MLTHRNLLTNAFSKVFETMYLKPYALIVVINFRAKATHFLHR